MSTELEVYKGEEQAEPLTERKAQALDKKIRAACDKMSTSREALVDLLDEAAKGQIHVALGFPSWTAWFSESVEIRPLDVADRKELGRMMASKGMSTRAAAKALGCSQKTASRDLEGESFDSDNVTSLDGSQRQRSKPAAEPLDAEEVPLPEERYEEPTAEHLGFAEEPVEPLRPISEDFQDEMYNLQNTMSAFTDILEDERVLVVRTRNSLARKHVNELQDAIKGLQDVIDFLMG